MHSYGNRSASRRSDGRLIGVVILLAVTGCGSRLDESDASVTTGLSPAATQDPTTTSSPVPFTVASTMVIPIGTAQTLALPKDSGWTPYGIVPLTSNEEPFDAALFENQHGVVLRVYVRRDAEGQRTGAFEPSGNDGLTEFSAKTTDIPSPDPSIVYTAILSGTNSAMTDTAEKENGILAAVGKAGSIDALVKSMPPDWVLAGRTKADPVDHDRVWVVHYLNDDRTLAITCSVTTPSEPIDPAAIALLRGGMPIRIGDVPAVYTASGTGSVDYISVVAPNGDIVSISAFTKDPKTLLATINALTPEDPAAIQARLTTP